MSQWIISCNPKYYDVIGAFNTMDKINWKQSTNIKAGDTVYIYVAKPHSEIKYETIAIRVDLPESTIDDTEFVIDGTYYDNHGRYMELRLVRTFDTGFLPNTDLKQNGLNTVQGPTKVSEELAKYISVRKDQLQPKERQYFFVFRTNPIKKRNKESIYGLLNGTVKDIK